MPPDYDFDIYEKSYAAYGHTLSHTYGGLQALLALLWRCQEIKALE